MDVDVGLQSKLSIRPNEDYHGDEGPVSVAYPRFFYDQSGMIALVLDPAHQRGLANKADAE